MTRGSSQWRYHGGASWLKNERKKSPACRRGGWGGHRQHLSPLPLPPLCSAPSACHTPPALVETIHRLTAAWVTDGPHTETWQWGLLERDGWPHSGT